MTKPRFRTVGHTGDMALRLWGRDPADLLRSGGLALFHVLAAGSPICDRESRALEVEGADLEELLVGWMNRLLLLFHLEDLLLCRFDPGAPVAGRVRGSVGGEALDASRHHLVREVKAVTYHGVQVEREGKWWTARVVLDL
jgi:SHS2 domain-containing protein